MLNRSQTLCEHNIDLACITLEVVCYKNLHKTMRQTMGQYWLFQITKLPIRHLVHDKHFRSPLSCSVYWSNSHGSHTPFSEGARQAFFTYVPAKDEMVECECTYKKTSSNQNKVILKNFHPPAGQFRQQMLSCSYSMSPLQETSRLDRFLMDPWAQARSKWLLAACMAFSNNKIYTRKTHKIHATHFEFQ